jgi:hypothetical protein
MLIILTFGLRNEIHNFTELWTQRLLLNLFALAESVGFAVLISPLLIFIKKIADTTYSGPPFILFLRYHGIS